MAAGETPHPHTGDTPPTWPHVHDPNPTPPSADPTFTLTDPTGKTHFVTQELLARLPQQRATGCTIVSTGHGTSGPFDFSGVALGDLLAAYLTTPWQQVDVVSADGFGTRIHAQEPAAQTALLALTRDDARLTRAQGLVRLIVPDEHDDALRQVKWVARLHVT
jgi:hypothetical protein